ncbi:iron-sulfur cluster assembly scaffold protein [Candidatus Pelagibacter bacterium]|nr:iron-sulfur cluster assembly scaffold protein [Candidatus Pelagibacter bacterium]
MISKDIIKLASSSNNFGLKNSYSHKTSLKNSLCGDKITLELIVKNKKVSSMRYETEACIYCEASASLLSKKIKNLYLKDIKKDFLILKNFNKTDFKIPRNLSVFKKLFSSDNLSRIKCLILPFNAVLKALK